MDNKTLKIHRANLDEFHKCYGIQFFKVCRGNQVGLAGPELVKTQMAKALNKLPLGVICIRVTNKLELWIYKKA